MSKPHPNRDAALWNLNCAINLHPLFTEAMELQAQITGKEVTASDNSSIRSFVRRQVMADQVEELVGHVGTCHGCYPRVAGGLPNHAQMPCRGVLSEPVGGRSRDADQARLHQAEERLLGGRWKQDLARADVARDNRAVEAGRCAPHDDEARLDGKEHGVAERRLEVGLTGGDFEYRAAGEVPRNPVAPIRELHHRMRVAKPAISYRAAVR